MIPEHTDYTIRAAMVQDLEHLIELCLAMFEAMGSESRAFSGTYCMRKDVILSEL